MSPLFEPFVLGAAPRRSLHLRNRLVMSPMTRSRCPGGIPGEDVVAYYRRRAEGGTGLIVTEGIGVDHPASVDDTNVPRLDGPDAVRAWRAVTDAVHGAGGTIAAQLWHVGPLWGAMIGQDLPHRDELEAVRPMRPSGTWGTPGVTAYAEKHVRRWVEPIAPMSPEEIAACLDAYRRSAALAVEAGFDAVEVHGGHGYLPDAFLWEGTNGRDDEWGGDLRRRTAFPAAVVRAVRAGAGADVPLLYRFSQHTQQDYKATKAADPAELGVILGALVDAGVDAFDLSARRMSDPTFPDSDHPGRTLAGWTRALTGLPTIAVGGFGLSTSRRESAAGSVSIPASETVTAAEAMLAGGECDLIAVGRLHLADPALATTLAAGDPLPEFDRELHEFRLH